MSAIFSPCRTWRYTLTRWAAQESHEFKTVAFIGLNPSTADETADDPTVRRCVGFARSWGYDRLVMLNVFAYRATDPKALYSLDYYTACGPHNFDDYIYPQSLGADLVVCAWGVHGALHGRGEIVRDRLRTMIGADRLHVLGLTRDGHPKHPLYLPGDLEPRPWEPVAV